MANILGIIALVLFGKFVLFFNVVNYWIVILTISSKVNCCAYMLANLSYQTSFWCNFLDVAPLDLHSFPYRGSNRLSFCAFSFWFCLVNSIN